MSPEQIFEQSAQFIGVVMYSGIAVVCLGLCYVFFTMLRSSED